MVHGLVTGKPTLMMMVSYLTRVPWTPKTETNGQTNIFLGLMNPIFNLNGSLPGCFRDEPKFENLEKCEIGCQVGTCLEANNTIGIVDGFKCECGPAHYGFNCKESTRLKVKK